MSFPADDPAARTDHAAEEPDAVLAASFSAGSDAAFAALYERYARPIHDFLRWTVRDAAAAEDLAQSTFLQALERRESLRDPAAFRGWLYRIAHNLAINHMTRTRAGEELDADAPYASDDPGPEQLAGAAEATELVWDAAASLEARQFAVLDLSVRKGLTSAEIAEVLEIDNAAASLAVHRAREALGNAVRFLLVARRRRHCERLAELVPEGVRRLTPEQRASVDRHMRRCPECQRTALLLTSAEQLFAATPLVSLPPILKRAPHIPKGKGRVARTGARRLLRSPWGLGAAAVVTAAAITTGALFVTHAGGTKPARRSSARSASTTAPGAPTAFASVAAAGFQPARTTNAPSTASFRAVACPSATHCFAVAENAGHALAASSSDSGATWKSAPVSDLSGLVAIACTSETACVAGGYAGNDQHAAVVRTSDAGSTWSPATVPAGVAIGSISCPDAKNCLAVGERQTPRTPYVVSSADGGATWEERAAPATGGYPGYLAAVQCIDAAHCWAVGGGIWFTDDLAGTWTDLTPPEPKCSPGTICGGPTHTLTAVQFTSPTEGWVVGGVPCGGYGVTQCPWYVAHTDDGGRTWHPPSDATLNRFAFGEGIACAGDTCIVVNDTFKAGRVSVTSDGGASWRQTQEVSAVLNAIGCSPDGRSCVVVGREGSLLAATAG